MPLAEGRRYAFSCGTQDIDWTDRNCNRCKVYDEAAVHRPPYSCGCAIADALQAAFWDDGSVSSEIARRMGLLDHDEDYCWDCPERVLSEAA